MLKRKKNNRKNLLVTFAEGFALEQFLFLQVAEMPQSQVLGGKPGAGAWQEQL